MRLTTQSVNEQLSQKGWNRKVCSKTSYTDCTGHMKSNTSCVWNNVTVGSATYHSYPNIRWPYVWGNLNLLLSVFRKLRIRNMLNFVCNCEVTSHSLDDELGRHSNLISWYFIPYYTGFWNITFRGICFIALVSTYYMGNVIIVLNVPVKIPTFTVLELHIHTHILHGPSTQTNKYHPVQQCSVICVTTLELLWLLTKSVVKTRVLDLHNSWLGERKTYSF